MIRFILVRFLQTVLALLGVITLVFLLVRLSGDPALMMMTSGSMEEDLVRIRQQLGLDKPQIVQYGIYLKGLVTGNLGESFRNNRPVAELISEALPNSLRLAVSSFIASMIIALLLGVLAATKRDTIFDNGVKMLAVLGQAMPDFWVGIMVILIFSVHWQIFPASGTDSPKHYVLPVAVLTFYILPGIMRIIRSSMLDVLDSEYIKLARIKGVPEKLVIWKHALRNALIAPLTTAGLILAGLIAGVVVIEYVFTMPGLGSLSLEGMALRDFPVVQGVVLVLSSAVLVINFLVEVLYAVIDPQIRYQYT
ncbi:MAG: ABC transporter permease [Spirochaetes bacterium]|nr:ABC transporter permease [Spirochaetota bacterium]